MITVNDLETAAGQWQETVKTLIQTFNRIVTKYLTYDNKTSAISENIYQKSFYLFRITNKHVFSEVTVILKVLLNSKLLDARQKQTLLEEMESWLKKNKNQGQAVHDMMTILMAVLDDASFLSVKAQFQLVLRIFVEIIFFSAFSDEYSTYFYNLEVMARSFVKTLVGLLVAAQGKDDFMFVSFANALPEILVTKIINKKANETGNAFMASLTEEVVASLEEIRPDNLKLVFEKLLLVLSLRLMSPYMALVDQEKDCLYVNFYARLKQLVDGLIERRLVGKLELLFDLFSAKSLFATELFSLRTVKYKERVIEREIAVVSAMVSYLLDHLANNRPKTFSLAKLLAFLRLFLNGYLKVEGMFSVKVEEGLAENEQFLHLVFDRLSSCLATPSSRFETFQVVRFAQQEFVLYAETVSTAQLISKRCAHQEAQRGLGLQSGDAAGLPVPPRPLPAHRRPSVQRRQQRQQTAERAELVKKALFCTWLTCGIRWGCCCARDSTTPI
jgi:hypothetical protein